MSIAPRPEATQGQIADNDPRVGLSAAALKQAVVDHLRDSIGRPARVAGPRDYYRALVASVRDRMQRRWIATTETDLVGAHKVACYLSAEFLMGPHLGNHLLNFGIEEAARTALSELGYGLDEILACEEEPGLGNGGSDGSPPATWIRWPPWSGRPSAMASVTSSASSIRRSATAGRPRSPTNGCAREETRVRS